MTSVLPIREEMHKLRINNFKDYTMFDSSNLTNYFGFTDDEVKKISDTYNLDYNKIKEWYGNYKVNGIDLFNACDVHNICHKSQFDFDYNATGRTCSIIPVFNYIKNMNPTLGIKLSNMLKNECLYIDFSKVKNNCENIHTDNECINVLIHLGFLATYKLNNSKESKVYIPNKESWWYMFYMLKDINNNDIQNNIENIRNSVEKETTK